MLLILPPKSRKIHLREYAFSNFPGEACSQTPLSIACQRHATVGLRPKYPPIIARFPPVKNFSYIPARTITSQSQPPLWCMPTLPSPQRYKLLNPLPLQKSYKFIKHVAMPTQWSVQTPPVPGISELTQQDGRGKKTANLVWQPWQQFCLK